MSAESTGGVPAAAERGRIDAEIVAERLRRLQRVTSALSSARTVHDVAQVVLTHGLANPGARSGALFVVSEDRRALRCVGERGLSTDAARAFSSIPLETDLPGPEVVRTGQPVFVRSRAERDERWPALRGTPTEVEALAVVPLAVEGEVIGCIAMGFPQQRDFDESKREFLAAMADQCAQALDRARLYDAEQQATRRMAFLARASKALASTLDYERTLALVSQLGGDLLGGRCAVELDPEAPAAPGDGWAGLAVPLVVRGHALGVLRFDGADAGALRPADLALVEDFAGRAAVAVENARLFAERTEIAHTLQRSLLPPRLPAIEGVELAARFRPAYEGLEVGGDFYDVFPVREAWGLVIGDVVGIGARAAATTALVRHTVRAVAPHLADPCQVAAAVNEALGAAGDDAFCTLVYGMLRRDAGVVRIALVSAGHPPPLLVRADGRVEEVRASGTLLGPFESIEVEPVELRLEAGDALVCFTDGVLDARAVGAAPGSGPESFLGEDRLRAVLAGRVPGSADELADRIQSAVLAFSGGQVSDDIAILVVRAAPGVPEA